MSVHIALPGGVAGFGGYVPNGVVWGCIVQGKIGLGRWTGFGQTHTSFRVFENLVFHCNTNLHALLIVWRFESMRLCVAFSLFLFSLDKTQYLCCSRCPFGRAPKWKSWNSRTHCASSYLCSSSPSCFIIFSFWKVVINHNVAAIVHSGQRAPTVSYHQSWKSELMHHKLNNIMIISL